MSKQVKNLMIKSIKSRIDGCSDLIFMDISKIPAFDCNKLRNELSLQGIKLLTVKNAVAKCALREVGFTIPDGTLAGPITLLFGARDIVELSKTATGLTAKVQTVRLCGGVTTGTTLSVEQVEALSKSPSREELLGQIAMLIMSPARSVSSSVAAVSGLLASQIKSISQGD